MRKFQVRISRKSPDNGVTAWKIKNLECHENDQNLNAIVRVNQSTCIN